MQMFAHTVHATLFSDLRNPEEGMRSHGAGFRVS